MIRRKAVHIILGALLFIDIVLYIHRNNISEPEPAESITKIHPELLRASKEIRENLNQELAGFNVSQLSNRTSASSLQDLTPETNGQPIINLIVTTFRSGSNFMEDLLKSFPGTFAHHETLWHFGPLRIRDEAKAAKAISDLDNMMHCDYFPLKKYIDTINKQRFPLERNDRVWEYLSDITLYSESFLTDTCKMFPVQVMKLTRMLLKYAEALLMDETLNLQVIFLVRDPRGMMLSRWELAKTMQDQYDINYEFNNPEANCGDMETDYWAAKKLIKRYPRRFTVVRYEDFASNIYQKAPELFKWMRMPFHEQVVKYLDEHTHEKKGDLFSTARDTNSTVFRWKNDITFEQLQEIQKGCVSAMKLWRYRVAQNMEELRNDFYPVYDFDYTFSDPVNATSS